VWVCVCGVCVGSVFGVCVCVGEVCVCGVWVRCVCVVCVRSGICKDSRR